MPVNISPTVRTDRLSTYLGKINPIINTLEAQDEALIELTDEVATQTQSSGPSLVLLFENGLV